LFFVRHSVKLAPDENLFVLIVKFLHRYIGLLVCGFLFAISVTGSLLLLKREYLWISMPEARASIDYSLLAGALKSIQEHYHGESIFVQLHSANLSIHKVFLPKRQYAYFSQNGTLLKTWQGNGTLEDWLLDFHHRFLLGNTIGLNMAGASGLLAIPLALIGLFLWWPYRRFWKLKLRFSAKHSYARNSHSNLGVVLVAPLLLIAFTGVILVYPTESRWLLQNGFSANKPKPVLVEKELTAISTESDSSLIGYQIAYALNEFPDAKLRWMQTSTNANKERVIGLSQQGAWDTTGKTSIRFHDKLVTIKNARKQSTKVRAVDLSYALHIGDFHFLYRLFLFFIGLSLCALTFFGLRSFYLRRYV